MIMKSKLITASIGLLFFAMLICTVSAQNVELLSKGNTFTYKRYHIWESNDPNATPSPDVDFFTRNNSIIIVIIDNVSSTLIGVQITVQYQNGTQIVESMIHDMVTGYNTPNYVFPNAVFGDSRTDFIQKPQEQVDHTEKRTYGEITREVNVFSYKDEGWTGRNSVYNVTIVEKRCFDAQTGMFLESESELFMYNRNNINLNQTIHSFFVLNDTNVWVAPNPLSNLFSPLSLPPLSLLIVSIVIVVAFAAVVCLKKRKKPLT